ncbi:synaptotagmin-15 isoform X2 [Ixodes scapularis]|uniref:synaptotagmin-15 isoform X2 n=1 Tax=Ixodes scapularis TaxID=6945 RepID=UPI001A9D2CEC|nr:synaptotagmin-15 isoform X2 [Ixodes scapularis]
MTPEILVWVIAGSSVAGLIVVSLVVWLVVAQVRGTKGICRKSGQGDSRPPLLGHDRKSILSKSLAGSPLSARPGDKCPDWVPSVPTLLTPESFNVQSASLTAAEPVQPIDKPGFVRWNSFCSPSAEGLVGNLLPRSYSCGYTWSDDEDTPTAPPSVHGRLWFSLTYRSDDQELDVNVIKAKYLPGRGLNNAPRDPFVRVYLLPDDDTFRQTEVKRRTLSPKFEETVTFKIEEAEVRRRTLRLSVYDIDRRKVRHCLGHVMLNLEKEPLTPEKVIWMELDNVPKKSSQIGEIQISLTCNPFTNRIKAAALQVRRFSRLEENSTSVYVKLSLNHGRKSVKEKATEVREWRSADEVSFTDVFSFGVAGRYFDSCSLCFTVMVSPDGSDYSRLGKTVLGPFMYARGEELRHWQDMLTNPRSAVVRWHALEVPTGRDEWKSD